MVQQKVVVQVESWVQLWVELLAGWMVASKAVSQVEWMVDLKVKYQVDQLVAPWDIVQVDKLAVQQGKLRDLQQADMKDKLMVGQMADLLVYRKAELKVEAMEIVMVAGMV